MKQFENTLVTDIFAATQIYQNSYNCIQVQCTGMKLYIHLKKIHSGFNQLTPARAKFKTCLCSYHSNSNALTTLWQSAMHFQYFKFGSLISGIVL